MVLDSALLNTQHDKVGFKSKVKQSRERSSVLPYASVLEAVKKGHFESPSTTVAKFYYLFILAKGESKTSGCCWSFGFYGISTFVGYLPPNLFLYKQSVLFQTIQFSPSTQFNCQKHFYFKLLSLFKQF